jgi:exopolysaccharide biosynthesis protein
MNRNGLALVLITVTLLGCTLAVNVSETVTITPEIPPLVADPWQVIAPGIEQRAIDISLSRSTSARAILVRLDPAWVTFRVHYSPGTPYSINAWRDQLPDAAIIVNGGFFDENDYALGLLVSDGQAYGQPYSGFGGMFQVDTAGLARVRSLINEPYQGESLAQAVQAFPMLVEAYGARAPQDGGFDDRSRRTLVAQDSLGRILLVVIPYTAISLSELQNWLLSSDFDIQIAFGLDGGRSTSMVINTPGLSTIYFSLDKVPDVIAVYSR